MKCDTCQKEVNTDEICRECSGWDIDVKGNVFVFAICLDCCDCTRTHDKILAIAEAAWLEHWEQPLSCVFPGNFEQFMLLKEEFLQILSQQLLNAKKHLLIERRECIESAKADFCGTNRYGIFKQGKCDKCQREVTVNDVCPKCSGWNINETVFWYIVCYACCDCAKGKNLTTSKPSGNSSVLTTCSKQAPENTWNTVCVSRLLRLRWESWSNGNNIYLYRQWYG